MLDISGTISSKSSITDWLSVFIYTLTFIAAVTAAFIAKKALNENKRIANDTNKMTSDNKRLVDTQTEPFVDISLEVMPESVNWIRLKIQNLGLSSAFNIKFTVKNMSSQSEKSKKVIDLFFQIGFMKQGLSYLSKGDSRYTHFINLFEEDEERGFTVDEFFNTQFIVEIIFEDSSKKPHRTEFMITVNELEGIYRIGKSFEEQLIEEMKNLNTNLNYIKNEQKNFNYEYEKTHRDWTEEELQRTLSLIQTRRRQREFLNLPPDENKHKKPNKKLSINQIRKQMK